MRTVRLLAAAAAAGAVGAAVFVAVTNAPTIAWLLRLLLARIF